MGDEKHVIQKTALLLQHFTPNHDCQLCENPFNTQQIIYAKNNISRENNLGKFHIMNALCNNKEIYDQNRINNPGNCRQKHKKNITQIKH